MWRTLLSLQSSTSARSGTLHTFLSMTVMVRLMSVSSCLSSSFMVVLFLSEIDVMSSEIFDGRLLYAFGEVGGCGES